MSEIIITPEGKSLNSLKQFFQSCLTGVTILFYSQQALWHNFSQGRQQSKVSFTFKAVGTVEAFDKIGNKIIFSQNISGNADLLRGYGTLTF